MILLAERFTGPATREWWINRKMAGELTPNCWVECPELELAVPTIKEVAFHSLIIAEFSNPMDVQLAMAELKRLKWDSISLI